MKARLNFLVFLIGVSTVFFSCKTVPQSQEKNLKPKTGKKVFVEVSERIADAGQLSAGQLADYFMSVNPTYDYSKINALANYYVMEGRTEGINSDVAFAQMCLETGYLRYGNLVQPEWNNFCGLGAIDQEHPGEQFETVQLGVRAHIQHLHAYSTTEDVKLVNELVDKRYKWVKPRGKAPAVEQLAGTWAADKNYGTKIKRILEQMQNMVNLQ
jgi:hypothetical protein